ncbi:histone deacetylase complex subunit SAP30L-like [Sinocyclocheilus rhinocerous]|uniref:histone deacetylase complex subunit SAP30L-like n=2 Tax=Sinocyclocheilus TaxID=75365 RepID=UPI0007B99673|nr:PREDICTED: histone deacetylase complex subunit SAP30L-like [Sinocyclocheilus rhinocerous]
MGSGKKLGFTEAEYFLQCFCNEFCGLCALHTLGNTHKMQIASARATFQICALGLKSRNLVPCWICSLRQVDLFQLQVNTLRRYKRHYKIQTRPGLNKAQLAETVSRHFRNIPVNEKETLTYFIYMVKSSKSRLDQKSDGSKQVE